MSHTQKEYTKGTPPKSSTSHDASNVQEREDMHQVRIKKLEKIRESYYDPYMQHFQPNGELQSLNEQARNKDAEDTYNQAFLEKQEVYKISGRIRTRRIMGKAIFLNIADENSSMQIYCNLNLLGEKTFDLVKNLLDLGDIIGVEGTFFVTKTGQLSLRTNKIIVLAKALQPLPVVKESDGTLYDAFEDIEMRYRMRYVDLIVNNKTREVFKTRTKIISYIRHFLEDRNFLEVETPMMQKQAGGAKARPFVTYHNTLDRTLYLRIAPELYLKRLVVGGFHKVFEINKNFRNEGISIKHNPEFTMLELYEAYSNMQGMLSLCENLVASLAKDIVGTYKVPYGKHILNFEPPWEQLSYLESIKKYTGLAIHPQLSLSECKKDALNLDLTPLSKKVVEDANSIWNIAELLFDEKVEPYLIQPVFITHFPKAISPLAKEDPAHPDLVERFEPYIAAREIGNAFSELNDPLEQLARFKDQARDEDEESLKNIDYDYVRALEYAMPPTGGLGIGIDRLVMILTNVPSIRDSILFPVLRDKN